MGVDLIDSGYFVSAHLVQEPSQVHTAGVSTLSEIDMKAHPPSFVSWQLARLETSGVDINFPPTDSDFPVFHKTEMCHQLGPN